MTREPDDDALGWAGETDPTLVSRAGDSPREGLAPGWTPVGEPGQVEEAAPTDGAPTTPPAEEASEVQQTGSVMLVILGVLGGIYLLYTVGWMIAAGRIPNDAIDVVGGFMFTLGAWLAVAAPALWFAVTLWLCRERPRARLSWLVVGVVLLVPLPFIMGAGVGA